MPIQIKAPDGSIAQFPDGMADADIEKVMTQHYPQPSGIDRAVGFPLTRLAHDFVGKPLEGIANLLADPNGSLPMPYTGPQGDVGGLVEKPYQAALARNRNTPGYAAARANADKATAARGSGFADQMLSPILPSVAGAMGAPGGFDAMNANADAQQQAQDTFASNHPALSFGANLLGGAMLGPSQGPLPAALPRVSTAKPFAKEAMDAGYTLPPRMISDKPGIMADVLSGWGGKVKTAQAASAKNQDITNALTARSLGLPEDTVITDQVLRDVRKNASQAYGAIPKALPTVAVDGDFTNGILKLGDKSSAAASEFPELLQNPEIDKLVSSLSGKTEFSTDAGISLVRKLRKDASSNFKAAGDPSKLDLAFAQRQAADHIDDLIERNLAASGQEQLAADYRAARQTLAKSHDIEAATNTTTGNVSAKKIAALANRGRPLSGDLETVANTANAFPKAMQSEAAFGEVEPISVLDVAAGMAALPHNPSLLGAVVGRPLARSAALSRPVQERLLTAAQTGARPPALQLPRLPANAPIPYGLFGAQMLPQRQ